MKRITKFLLVFVFVLSVFTLTACKKDIKVSDITIGNPAISLEEEAMEQINVTVLPENAKDKTVSYVSESPAIATVSDSGLVTGIAIGSTKIIVKAGKIEKEVTVTVTEKGPEPLNITAALALEDKAELTLRGQVIGIQGTQAWLADSAAGISIYQIPEAEMAKFVIGNVVVVTGKRADYSGTKQIGSVTAVKVVETGKPAIASINLTDLSAAKLNASKQKSIKGTFEVTQVPELIEYNEDGSLKNHLTYKVSDGTNEVIFYVKKYLSVTAITAMKATLEAIEVGGTITFDKAVVTWYNSIPQVLVLNNSIVSFTSAVVVNVTGVEVTNAVVKLDQEATSQIEYAVLPINATDKSVTFTSSDEAVATVSETGLITGIAIGEATITVKAGTFEKAVAVTVTEKPLTITEALAVDNDTEVFFKGQVIGTQGSQAWLSDGIAGISLYQIPSEQMEKIVVGNVIVVAGKRADYSGTKQIGSITLVEVRQTEQPAFDSIVLADLAQETLNNTIQQIMGGSFEISAVPSKIEYNEDGSLKNHLTYKITDGENEVVFYVKKYLSVETITAIKDVLEEIEVGGTISFDNVVVSWFNSIPQIMVLNESVFTYDAPVDPTSVVIKAADDFALNVAKQLEAIAIPVGKAVTYTWSVNDEAIATISATGELTFLAPGDVIVSVVVVEFPGLTASKTFTLEAPEPTSITIEGESKIIIHPVPKTYQYEATVMPAGAVQSFTWSVSDVTKATVDPDTGIVTPIAEGSIQLIATSKVNEAISKIKFVQIETYIEPEVVITGSPMVAKGIATPFSATVKSNFLSKKVVWSISDELVATISEDGVVTGLKEGTAIVTATSVDDALLKATFTVEVIVITQLNMVIDAAINEDSPFELVYNAVTYYKGINAFAQFSDAAALVQDGAIIYVMPGEYTQKATINANNIQILGPNEGVNPVTSMLTRTGEAIIQNTLTFGSKTVKVNGVKIDGLKFTGSGQIYAPYGIDSLEIYNVWYTEPSINPAQGMIYLGALTEDVTSNDFVVENSYFDDSTFLGYRGIRLNNTKNITINNNYFYQFFDAIRIECTNNGGFNVAPVGIGAAGVISISGNEFEMNRQYPIIMTVVTATEVTINHNTISSNFEAGGTWGQIYMSNVLPVEGIKTIVDIKYNTFENMNNYHSIRIKSNGATNATLEYNVNYNKWLAKNNLDESYIYCSMGDDDVDVVTNAANNYFAFAPVETDFTNVNTFEPFFTDLEAFEIAKAADLGGEVPAPTSVVINPAEDFVLNEEKQLSAYVSPVGEVVTYEWSVDNELIATISADGKLKFIAYGEVIVTVKVVEHPEITVTKTFKLEEVLVDLSNILVDPNMILAADEVFTFDGVEYIVGATAFVSLNDALAVLEEGSTLTLREGVYNQAFAINLNDITLKGAVSETAVITNKITVSGANGLTISNLSFTEIGQIYAKGALDNFVFDSNIVYSSVIPTSGYLPTSRIDVNAFIQFYTLAGSNVIGNVTITNNTFNGMTSDIISLDRTSVDKVITITDNEFRNFSVGAIRFDGGYNNGTYNILRNIFENDELGGYAAIVFRAYSSSAGATQTINIDSNLFMNIGNLEYVVPTGDDNTYPGSAVITSSTFNDVNVTLNIKNNEFVNNFNDIHLRNVGANSTTWAANVNNNEFRGTLGYIYYESVDLTDLNDNYYEDAEGNAITDLVVLGTLIKTTTNFTRLSEKEGNEDPTSVVISPVDDFVLNEEKQLVASILPAGAIVTYEWSVDNELIATISNDGKLTFIAYGEVIVTVKVIEFPEIIVTRTFVLEAPSADLSNILIDASINEETPSEIVYGDITYIKGENAFASFAEAAAVAIDGSIINVKPGEYAEGATFTVNNLKIYGPNKGVNPVLNMSSRTEEAIVKMPLILGTDAIKLNGVTIDGLKFVEKAQIYAPYGVDGLSIHNVWFFDSNLDGTQGAIYVAAPTIGITSSDFVVEDSVFNDSLFLGNRGVRLNNTINITINNNYFYKYWDAIRIESTNNGGFNQLPTGIGAAGVVSISGNEFEMTQQYTMLLSVVSATLVNVTHNVIAVDPVSVNTNGQVYMSNLVPQEGTKTVVNIKYNTFVNTNDYHSVRLQSKGCTAETLEYNVNYNKWMEKKKAGHDYVICVKNETDTDIVTDASNNYFAFTPLAEEFTNVITFEPYFSDLVRFEYEKSADMNPEELFLLLDKDEIQAGQNAQVEASLEGTIFTTSNNTIATVDENGLITGLRGGSVIIIANNGEKNASVELVVLAENLMVDPAWSSEETGAVKVVNEIEYIIGYTGFATLADAVGVASSNATILVMAGEYDGGFDVISSGVSIIAPNANTNPVTDETPFLLASATAVHINTEFYVSASNVTIKGISMTGNVRIRGFKQISNFRFENNYVYDTYTATVDWKETTYATDTTSAGVNTPGVINFAGSYTWQTNFKFINNKFSNVNDTNIFLGYADGATFEGNYFGSFGRDAVRLDYGQNKGIFMLDGNTFVDGKLNGIYIRGYSASYGGSIDVTLSNNTFENVGLNPDGLAHVNIEFAAFTMRNHAEKDNATFNIFRNKFIDCPVALSLRNNYAAKYLTDGFKLIINVNYNAFINELVPTYYHRNQFGGDTNLTNPADAMFKYNFYGSSETVAVTPIAAQFNNATVNHEHDFATYADLVAGLSPAGNLFFSEYVEGTSNNKAMEIYNNSGENIDLAGYVIELSANGKTEVTFSIALSGLLKAGESYVIVNPSSEAALLAKADMLSGGINHNGDDFYLLKKGVVILDSFGQYGFDPGTSYGPADPEPNTKDMTWVRMPSILTGDPIIGDVFDPLIEWVSTSKNDYTGLGSHTID